MVAIGRLLWERGLVGATEGNFSCRSGPGRILMSPAGLRKGFLDNAELSVIDLDGNVMEGAKPSSEYRMHLAIYRASGSDAVVHAHPPFATAFALANRSIPGGITPEADLVLGRVALIPYGTPGTDELSDTVLNYASDHQTMLLANHGATTTGGTLDEAYDRMETLERVAKSLWIAESLGGAKSYRSGDLR